MFNVLVATVVLSLVLTEAWAIEKFMDYFKAKSDAKTEQRRELYRKEAYARKNERRAIKDARASLWQYIEGGK